VAVKDTRRSREPEPLADLPLAGPLDFGPQPPGRPVSGTAGSQASAAPEQTMPGAALGAGERLLLAAEQQAQAPAATAPAMDRDFIARNQIVERYFSGRLPVKGATEFERFCQEHPELLDELGLPDKVNAALRLLEAGGKPSPWEEPKAAFWQKLEITVGLAAATLILATALVLVATGSAHKSRTIAALRHEAMERPLQPAASTSDIRLLPSRQGASDAPSIMIGGGAEGVLADFRIDESRSPYRLFRITIDRINQGRVGIIDRIAKDSNGNLRIALNTTALGPGNYLLTIDGLTWQGAPEPDSWVTIGIRPSGSP
jgi:hypothetical protein